MRKLLLVMCMILLISGCGYNRIMLDHLSKTENYAQYDVTVMGISYRDAGGTIHDFTEASDIATASTVLLEVCFSSEEELAPFLGVSADSIAKGCEDTPVVLEINEENNKTLYDNGFYSMVTIGAQVTITASNWIYMDGDFFYVSAVTYNGVEYLSEETGLSNIVTMIQKD